MKHSKKNPIENKISEIKDKTENLIDEAKIKIHMGEKQKSERAKNRAQRSKH